MLCDHLEFHNVQELAELPGEEGRLLCRVPQSLNSSLHPATAEKYRTAGNTEIRFLADQLPVSIFLTVFQEPAAAAIYFGDHLYRSMTLPTGPQTLRIEDEDYLEVFLKTAPRGCFHPHVIRILFFSTRSQVVYRGWESSGSLRPPVPGELPGLRYLAYGTSITHGFNASNATSPYCFQLARRMQADLYNMGSAGAAFLEEDLGRYIAENYAFDIFTAEISVNMLNQGYTGQEFYRRARAFLSHIDRLHPQALKAVISILPCFLDLGIRRPAMVSDVTSYRRILKDLAEEFEGRYLFLDGPQLLSFSGLSCDLIHPGDLGMTELAENLHRELTAYASSRGFSFFSEPAREILIGSDR